MGNGSGNQLNTKNTPQGITQLSYFPPWLVLVLFLWQAFVVKIFLFFFKIYIVVDIFIHIIHYFPNLIKLSIFSYFFEQPCNHSFIYKALHQSYSLLLKHYCLPLGGIICFVYISYVSTFIFVYLADHILSLLPVSGFYEERLFHESSTFGIILVSHFGSTPIQVCIIDFLCLLP